MRILFLILLISQLNSFTQTLIPYRIGDKWGYCNLEKKIIIKPQFEDVNPFNFYNDNGVLSNISYAIVKMNGKYGIIDTLGNFVLKPEYSKIEELYSNGVALYKKGEFFKNYDIKRNKKTRVYIIGLRCGGGYETYTYSTTEKDRFDGYIVNKLNNQYELTKRNGEVIGLFDSIISPQMYGLSCLYVLKKNHFMVLNWKGETVYDEEDITFSLPSNNREAMVIRIEKDNKHGVLSCRGQIIAYPKYKSIEIVKGPAVKVTLFDGSKGYVYMGVEYWEN